MRIVVVEDEAPIREGLSRILGKLDERYELVGKADNGKNGLTIIREQRPDLIIMDIQMPDMDGLTMLTHVREEGLACRAVVLSAYSDFNYAKQAIELGIENYLLKPIKIPELKRVLARVEESIRRDQSQEYLISLDHIFLDAVTGQFEKDEKMAQIIEERYGIAVDEEIVLFGVSVSEENCRQVRRLLEETGARSREFRFCVMEYADRKSMVMLLWNIKDVEALRIHFEKNVFPALCTQVAGELTGAWGSCKGLLKVREEVMKMEAERGWNLLFERGQMISRQAIEERDIYPLKYPAAIEEQTKSSIEAGSQDGFVTCVKQFREYCRTQSCTPEALKEAVTRYMIALIHTAKEAGVMEADIPSQPLLNQMVRSVSWPEMEKVFRGFFERLSFRGNEGKASPLIQKAQRYIQEFYDQGITLEEISNKLRVSEEYLSTQFKKETGKTFSETIKSYRIDHVKQLLRQSSLKLNQIADMVGYSDPKYMSKVFKEEVGMLPTEYRKKNS